MRAFPTRALVAFAIASVAACGASGDDEPATEPTTPAATFGTVAPDEPTATVDDPGVGPTTSVIASDEADFPTGPPPGPDDVAPTTTVLVGPLPTPVVQLVEVGQFDRPVGIAVHPLDERVFVVEQPGRVIAIDDESATTVLDLTTMTEASGEQGLLGLAFHPELDLAYVNFIDADGDTVIAEFAIDPVSAGFDPQSFREVMTVEQPFPNHNGGALAFGPDGYLYIGLGDGGAAGDPERNSLDLATRLGKLLRIDPVAAGDEPFLVPPDNPFVGVDGADPTIWSVGLRNPWRISFDRPTGDLWIADVGQNAFEEIDLAPATAGRDAGRGLSFGWSAFEATTPFNPDQPTDGHTPPVIEYAHEDGHCSVSGGAVARDTGVDDLDGWFVYGDFCSGTIWGYDTTSADGAPVVVELAELPALVSIAIGPEGALYAVSNDGLVARFADG